MKKILSLLLVALMIVGMLPLSAINAKAATGEYVKATNIEVGDTVVFVYESGKMEMTSISTTSTKYGIGTAYTGAPKGTMAFEVVAGSSAGTFAFKNNGKYLYWTSGNSLNVNATLNANTSWSVSFDASGNAKVTNATDTTRVIYWNNSSPRFACYAKTGQQAIQIYKLEESSGGETSCDHTNAITTTVDATCTTAGSTTVTCECGYEKVTEIPALGHDFSNGESCANCGEKVTIVAYQITTAEEFVTGEYVVVANNGYALGQWDGSSWVTAVQPTIVGTNVIDAANGIWTLTVDSSNVKMTDSNGKTVLYKGPSTNGIEVKDGVWFWSVDEKGLFTFADGETATVKLASNTGSQNKFRAYNVATTNYPSQFTLYKVGTPCAHTNIVAVGEAKDATCDVEGLTAGEKCADCGKVIKEQEPIAALGHSFNEEDICANCGASKCSHANQSTVTTDATCAKPGSIVVTCDDCGKTISEEEIPATGEHNYVSVVNPEAACTTDGLKTDTCSVCGDIKTETIPAIGHNYVDGICANCSEPKPASLAGRYYIATIRSSGNYFYMTSTVSSSRFTAVDSGVTELPANVSAPEEGYVFVLVENADGTYSICAEGVEGNNYLGWNSGNSGILVAQDDALKLDVDKLENGLVNIHFAGDEERYLSLNGTSGNDYFAFYKGTQKQDLSLIPVVEGGSEDPDPSEPETPVDPPVTEAPDEPTEAPAVTSATITFDDKAKRTEFSTSKQVWTENGITVTNTGSCGDYIDPVRLYKNSQVVIAYPGMTKIEISCTSAEYKTNLVNSLKGLDAKVTESDNVVTIALYAPADDITFTLSSGQTRASKITVYVEAMCDHSWGEWETTKTPNCTEAGEQTATCSKCNETKIQSIDATGHNLAYDGNTAFACDKCDYSESFTLSAIEDINAAGLALENKGTTTEVYYAKGIVTYISGKNVYLEDATGGFCVYFGTAPEGIALGDEYLVWGKAYNYNGLIEFSGTTSDECIKVSSGNALPGKTVTIGELNSNFANALYLGERVTIENVTIGTINSSGTTTLTDADGNSINVYRLSGCSDEIGDNDIVTVTAIVSAYSGVYQLVVNPGTAAADVVKVADGETEEVVTVTIAEAKAGTVGDFYQVEGVVTFINGRNVFVQDETGAIVVYLTANAAATKVGDKVKVRGALKIYNGLIELDSVSETDTKFYNILSSDNTVEAQTVTIEQLLADTTNEYLAEKVLLENVYISYSSYKNNKVTYTLSDGKGNTIKIYEIPVAEEDVLSGGTIVTVPAVVSCYNGYQLLADNDAIEVTGTCTHETTELVNFEAATLSKGGYTGDTMCSVCGYYTARGEKTEALTNVESWGLTLQDDILVKFQINVDASIRETAQIVIKVGGISYKYAVSEDGLYTANVAAAQMCDNIVVQIINGEDKSEEKTYTVKAYAETILNDSEKSQYHDVVTAMLHYGAAAQTYFNYNSGNLANAGLEPAAEVDLSGVTAGEIVTCDGFYGASLLFEEKIAVRFYFTTEIEGATEKNGLYYIDVEGINPQDLDEVVTIEGLEVSYSPMNYILRMAEKGSENLKALVKALYAYYAAAEALTAN